MAFYSQTSTQNPTLCHWCCSFCSSLASAGISVGYSNWLSCRELETLCAPLVNNVTIMQTVCNGRFCSLSFFLSLSYCFCWFSFWKICQLHMLVGSRSVIDSCWNSAWAVHLFSPGVCCSLMLILLVGSETTLESSSDLPVYHAR